MKKSIAYLISLGLLIFASCKKDPDCPPAISSGNNCELFAHRSYPQLDISNNPAAWYKADIEGRFTSVGTGYEEGGLYYDLALYNVYRTTTPVFNPNGTEKRFNLYQMGFKLFKTKDFLGKPYGLLRLRSPFFDKDTVANQIQFVENLLTPGEKLVDDGTDEGIGWNIYFDLTETITSANQTNTSGAPMFTNAAFQSVPFNKFKITEVQKEDLGASVRFTFFCEFQGELYREATNPADGTDYGKYFGRIENATAKFYIDVNK